MIRVMVVEDEPPILRVITKFIASFGETFKVTATAINGQKALEILKNEPVDVVFTDIKMPVMNGLKLTQHIRENYADMIIVIISGFQDFEYARTALKFQVYDYLLKPIAEKNIHEVLDKIENELLVMDKEKQRQRIMSLINEKPVEETNVMMQIGYGAFLICIGPFPLIPNDSMLPARKLWEEINIETELKTILLSEEISMCFNGKSASEMVVVFETKNEERIFEAARELFKRLELICGSFVTLAAARHVIKLNDIGEVLNVLRDKLYVEIKLFNSQMLWIDEEVQQTPITLDTKLMTDTICAAVKSEGNTLKDSVLEVLKKFIETGFNQLQVVSFFYGLMNEVNQQNKASNKDASFLKMDIDIAVSNGIDDKGLAKDIAFMLKELSESDEVINEKGGIKDIAQHIAQQVENYLQNHYQESITTNMLSKKFGFVPSYISKLFRSYKGMSPSEYLTYYRIEKSKQILLSQPDILCKEVARMVGFSDQYHFSKTFKKQAGIWPTEYAARKVQ